MTFYNGSRHQLFSRSGEGHTSINPLIEEADDFLLDSEHHESNTTFRRRRCDGSDHDTRTRITTSENTHHHQLQVPPNSPQQHLTWNKLNTTLFAGLALLSAATTTSITLVPSMSLAIAASSGSEEWDYSPYYNLEYLEVYDGSGKKKQWIPFRIRSNRSSSSASNKNNYAEDNNISSSSIFASHLTSVVTLVTAFGKFINGVLVDITGARRLLLIYGLCTCLSLVGLKHSTTPSGAIGCCAAVEFFSSINWSAGIVSFHLSVMYFHALFVSLCTIAYY